MIALWITLWTSSHAPVTHIPAAIALPAVTHQSRNPGNTGHGTSHASHAPRAVTHAPPFSRGACVLRTRPSHALTTHRHVRYSPPMGKWSDTDRANALEQLSDGQTLADTSRQTGIPRRTLADWAKAAGIEVSTPQARAKTARAREVLEAVTAEKRANLAAGLLADAQRLRSELFAPVVEKRAMAVNQGGDLGQAIEVAEVHLDRPTPADQVKIMTAVAIAVDKIQLLTGEATERHEHVGPERTPEQEQELAKVLTLVQGAA